MDGEQFRIQLGQVWRYRDDQNRKYIVSCLTEHSTGNGDWVDGVVYRRLSPSPYYYARTLHDFLHRFNYVKEDNSNEQ